jgi:hypothetical protein
MNTNSNLVIRWAFWLKKKKRKVQKEVEKPNVEKNTRDLRLIDIFDCDKKYRYIIELLVQRGMISSVSNLWIDEGKGSKGVVVALLKYFYVQGYYKQNTKLTNKQIKDICWNTFGIKISIDHIKHTKSNDIIINYIPHANTLKL